MPPRPVPSTPVPVSGPSGGSFGLPRPPSALTMIMSEARCSGWAATIEGSATAPAPAIARNTRRSTPAVMSFIVGYLLRADRAVVGPVEPSPALDREDAASAVAEIVERVPFQHDEIGRLSGLTRSTPPHLPQ